MSKLTPKKKEAFLQTLADGGSVKSAADAVGVTRQAVYKLRLAHPDFAEEWDAAVEDGTDILEDVATERAKKNSDTLLIFLLKARRPEKFKDRQEIDHSGTVANYVMSKEEWEKQAAARLKAANKQLEKFNE